MNKKIQGIIIGGVVVAALGGTLAILELTGKGPESSSAAGSSSQIVASVPDEDEDLSLIGVEKKEIKAISVTNATGGFELERPASGKTEFNIKELTGLNLNSTKLSGLVEDVASLKAYKTVEKDAPDLAKYGLSQPETSFAVTFADGSIRTFDIGDVSAKKRYRYFCEHGKNTVYMVLTSSLNYMIDRKEEFVLLSLFGSQTDESFGRLEITRKDLDYTVAFENVEKDKEVISSQVMVEPIFAHLNITTSGTVTHGLFGLAAGRCELVFPNEEQKKEYGLTEPLARVHYKNGDEEYALIIGNGRHATDSDGNEIDDIDSYYCMTEGMKGEDCIWEIPATSVPWATFLPGDVITMMTSNKIFDVSEVKVTAEGEVYDYTLEGSEADNKVYWAKKNGQDINVDLFKTLYKFLLSFPTKEIYFDKVEGEPFLTIEVTRTDMGGDKIEFYKDSSRRVIAAVNGKPSFRLQSRWTDTFIENLGRLDRGEELRENP